MALLQVALDVDNLARAMQIADEAVKGGADWIEAGTILIKSEGMNAVRALKKAFPDHTLVADMKTMDAGAFEVEIASKSGADVVIILGRADDKTVKEAVRAGRKYGSRVMCDMITVEDKVNRAKELVDIGVDYICIHVGIDQQMEAQNPLNDLKKMCSEIDVPVAAAGGINSETAPGLIKAGAEVVIIGGAITKSADAEEATKRIKKSIETLEPQKTTYYKKYTENEIFEAFSKASTPNISDAMHRKGAMRGISHINGSKMVGRAYTVRCLPGDWSKTVEAIDKAKPGDVIVIDAGGSEIAVWGELATHSALNRELAGVVVDGAVRDIEEIMETDFPVFARHVCPNAGEPKGYGELETEIICGEVKVTPGDIAVGDLDGVVVVPKKRAQELANRALDVHEREIRWRGEIVKNRSSLSEVLELEKWEKIG